MFLTFSSFPLSTTNLIFHIIRCAAESGRTRHRATIEACLVCFSEVVFEMWQILVGGIHAAAFDIGLRAQSRLLDLMEVPAHQLLLCVGWSNLFGLHVEIFDRTFSRRTVARSHAVVASFFSVEFGWPYMRMSSARTSRGLSSAV